MYYRYGEQIGDFEATILYNTVALRPINAAVFKNFLHFTAHLRNFTLATTTGIQFSARATCLYIPAAAVHRNSAVFQTWPVREGCVDNSA
jgi:hypothetical protein